MLPYTDADPTGNNPKSEGDVGCGTRWSFPPWKKTRFSAFSGLSHAGICSAASIRRNSPSLSSTEADAPSMWLVNIRNM